MSVVLRAEKEIPHRAHVSQGMENDVHVVIGLNIVQTHYPWITMNTQPSG